MEGREERNSKASAERKEEAKVKEGKRRISALLSQLFASNHIIDTHTQI